MRATRWKTGTRRRPRRSGAWLDAYGMDDVDATITDVVGTFSALL